jgi:hypothetical protein
LISGYAFSLGGGMIMWSSKKQPTVATSSTRGKYMATCHATMEALWLRTLLHLISFEQKGLTTIYCNNEGAITLTKDLSFHAYTKHLDIQHHFVCECVESRDVKFVHLSTSEMPANALMKPLACLQFQYLIEKLGIPFHLRVCVGDYQGRKVLTYEDPQYCGGSWTIGV